MARKVSIVVATGNELIIRGADEQSIMGGNVHEPTGEVCNVLK